jgi:hypothetical protein
MPFLDSLDIANRVCQRCGVQQILDINEDSTNNTEITFAYDKLRRAELRRNIWTFAIRKAVLRPLTTTTLLLAPNPWLPTTTYMLGTVVADANGILWMSTITDSLANSPASTSAWEEYFGPMSADVFDSTTAYYAGEMCYKSAGNPGGFVIFMSLVNGNADVPSTATPWSATVQYGKDSIVSYSGSQWRSLIAVNSNISPASVPLAFDANAIYAFGNTATGSDGYIYTSLANSNSGHDPVNDAVNWSNTTVPAAWTNVPTLYPSSTNWLPIFAGLNPMPIMYPLGCGPVTDSTTKNIFRLPAGYLRKANQDPKAGAVSWLGAPGGASYTDWNIEGKFITSLESTAIVFRFGADVTDVTAMDDMFCEGLACRIAKEVVERLTQSTAKLGAISAAYKEVMGDARTVNAIEVGSEESPEDDWISVRI